MGLRCEQDGGEDRKMTEKGRRCNVRDLEPGTEYTVRVRCCGVGQWGGGARKPL